MNFCPKCGASVKEDAGFCHDCGYNLKAKSGNIKEDNKIENLEDNLEKENLEDNLGEKTEQFENNLRNIKSVLSSKISIGIIIACAFIVVFIFVGKTISSPQRTVASFQSAVNKSDTMALSKILCTTDGRIDLKSDTINPLVKSFKNTPSELSSTINDLNSQATNLKNGGVENRNSSLYITKVGRTLIFFPKYKIAFKPVFMTLTSNVKGADILIGGEKVAKVDSENFSKQFGPYLPGLYDIEGKADGSFGEMDNKTKVDFISDKKQEETAEALKGIYLKVNSDYANNEVYINNKDTKKYVNSGDTLGPVASGAKVYAIINYNGEKVKSSYSTLSDDDTIIDFDYSKQGESPEQQKNDINDMITGYAAALADALTSGNSGQLTSYMYPGSKLNQQQMDNINTYYKSGKFYEKYDSAVVNSYKMDPDGNSGTVDATEVYDINEDYGGPDSQTNTKTFENIYKFKYNNTTKTYQLTERTSAVEK